MPDLREYFAQFRKDTNALESRAAELLRHHPHHYAGCCDGEIKIAKTMSGLCAHFGTKSPRMAWIYLDPKPRTFILGKQTVGRAAPAL